MRELSLIRAFLLKLDGYRALAIKSEGKVLLRSRNDKDFSARYPSIVGALAALPDETVIDGEVVALDATGRPSFNALQNLASSKATLVYYAFDVLVVAGPADPQDAGEGRIRGSTDRQAVTGIYSLSDWVQNMGHASQDSRDRARIVLMIGCILSAVAAGPSVRFSARYHSGHIAFHVAFNAVLLTALCSPFVIIYLAGRTARRTSTPVTYGAVFSLLHGYLIYTTYTVRP